jgi:hypothetical protein
VLEQGRIGHLLKSRARQSVITGNRFDDGRSGQASYEVDLPNGGDVLLEGNTLVQSPLTENPVMLSYGAEGQPWPDSQLTVRGNTFINRRARGGVFLRVWHARLPPGTGGAEHAEPPARPRRPGAGAPWPVGGRPPRPAAGLTTC